MRPLIAITAALLALGTMPGVGHADGMPPGTPGCHCPRPVRHVVRHVHYRVRRAHRVVTVAYAPRQVFYYNTMLPHPWDTDYDRGMVLHYRSPPVAGIYNADPGYAQTPDVAGVQAYRIAATGTVYQFDGMVGQYVQLSQRDAARALPPAPLLPPPPPIRPASVAGPAPLLPPPPPPPR